MAPKKKTAKATKMPAKSTIRSPQTHTITGPHHHHDGVCCAEDHGTTPAKSCSTNCWPMCCPLFATLLKPTFWLGSVIAFIILLITDIFLGELIAPMFQSTLHLWRPEAEVMANFMIYYYITLALAATAVTTLIILIGRCDWWGGTVAGALAMAPAAAYAYGSYVWTPFPTMEIPLTCAAIQLLQGALIGLALTALFKAFPKLCPCQSCCGTMGGCCCK